MLPVMVLAFSQNVLALDPLCGDPMSNGTGPWDYRTTKPGQIRMVENRHYSENVRALKRGESTDDVGSDLAYTLRVFPNHPHALLSMAAWSLKTNANPPRNTHFTVECWFERGIHFRPDDATVKMVYGIYLIKKGKPSDAVKQFKAAEAQGETSANLYYNLGLAYLDANEYDKALASAHRAYAAGFPLPGLKNRLVRAGKWRDAGGKPTAASPEPEAAPEESPPATSADDAAASAATGEARAEGLR